MRSQNFAGHPVAMTDANHEWLERELLARKLAESGMSARKAAEKMRITDTRLRHIINGYQPVGRGQKIEVVAPADTLADIALALKIEPDEMAATGRSDAAAVMEKILGNRLLEYSIPGDRSWNQILASHEEIRNWAEEGIEVQMPPDVILEMFTDDQLLGEIGRRMRYGSPFVSVPSEEDGDSARAITEGSVETVEPLGDEDAADRALREAEERVRGEVGGPEGGEPPESIGGSPA